MVLPTAIAAVGVPFLVAFGACGLLRGRRGLSPLAGAAIGLAMLAAFAALTGDVPFIGPTPAHHRVGELLTLFTVAGAGMALFGDGVARWRTVVVWAALVSVGWSFGFERLEGLTVTDLLLAAVIAVAAVAIMLRLAALSRSGAGSVGIVAVASLGLAAVAFFARSALIASLTLALASACCGWLIWARPAARTASATGSLVAGAACIAIAVETIQTALHPPWAMALLPLCFWPEAIASRIPVLARGARRKANRPLILVLAAALPAVAAALTGWAASLASRS